MFSVNNFYIIILIFFNFQLVIAAVDNGTPAQFESLRLLTVVLVDDNDNAPRFPSPVYQFTIKENLLPGVIIGKI